VDTVVLLGAGFSRALTEGSALPMPLCRDVLSKRYAATGKFPADIRRGPAWYTEETAPLVQVLTKDFAAELADEGWVYPGDGELFNYEHLYSHLMMQDSSPLSRLGEREIYENTKSSLIHYLCNVFKCRNYFDVVAKPNLLLEQFLNAIEPNYTIFTTNNDDILWQKLSPEQQTEFPMIAKSSSESESCLQWLSASDTLYGFRENNPSIVYLHGSINWITCTNLLCPTYAFPHRRPPEGGITLQTYCPVCGRPSFPEILAPVTMKDYSAKPLYGKMLRQFSACLIGCDRLVICGYGFNKLDSTILTTFLFAIGYSANIHKQIETRIQVQLIHPTSSVTRLVTSALKGIGEIMVFRDIQHYLNGN
jgi:hypothetical protein